MCNRLVLTMILTLGLGLGACATVKGHNVPAGFASTQIEEIQGAAFTRDSILLKVRSNGCTDKDDIKPFITQLKTRTVMTLYRLEEDVCSRGTEQAVTLQWSFDELGIAPGTEVELANPYLHQSQAH